MCILAIPGFLFSYFLPHYAKNRYKKLPIFGKKEVAATFHTKHGQKIPDTIYHNVSDFKYIDQKGDSVSWNNFRDKIVILNLFYTQAPSRAVSNNIRELADGYKKNSLINFLSLSVDPNDDASTLKSFAKQMNAKQNHWDLLSGDTAQVYPFVRNELNLDMVYQKEGGKQTFIYGNQVVLLDTDRRIRGYYEATNPQALAKLDDEIKVLVAEYLRNLNDGR
ncbi:SCO family protein [Pedobacter sp. UYP30]|uniref:SCO family protein n=1 Tax=Pedobacter sp. UYP30 TaxID=1756400 RepID=UPI003398A523